MEEGREGKKDAREEFGQVFKGFGPKALNTSLRSGFARNLSHPTEWKEVMFCLFNERISRLSRLSKFAGIS